MYLRIEGNNVVEIVPEINPAFPEPLCRLENRYPPEYVARLMLVPDDTVVGVGWTMTAEGFVEENESAAPPINPSPEPTLREQVSSLTQQLVDAQMQNEFLANCIMEMAQVVYAESP